MAIKVGEKIRKIRELKGISQEYIASQLHVSQQAYGKIEREEAKLDVKRLEEIARILKVDLSDIINFDEGKIFNNKFYDNSSASVNNHAIYHSNPAVEKMVALLQTEIAQLQKTNELLLRFIEQQK